MKKLKKVAKNLGAWLVKAWLTVAKIVGSLVLGLVLLIVLAVIFTPNNSSSSKLKSRIIQSGGENQIAFVQLNGEIVQFSDDSLLGFNPFVITPNRTRDLFSELATDEQVKAVVIKLNSPGGSVVASDEIYQQLKKLQQAKPIVMLFGDVAASGGYYIAAAADKIVASPASLTGSIGVIMLSPNFSGLYDKLGVEITTFKSGQYKDLGSPNRSISEAEAEILQSLIDDSYQLFIDRIEAGRDLNRDKILELADGRVYSGLQARQNGLVDQVGGVDEAVQLAAQLAEIDQPTVVEFSSHGGFWDSILSSRLTLFSPLGTTQLMPRSGLYYLWEGY